MSIGKRTIAAKPGNPKKGQTFDQSRHVDLSPSEIKQRQDEEAAWISEKPMRDWMEQITRTDKKIPRFAEDLIDVLTQEQRDSLAAETLSAYQEKKELRTQKPVEGEK